MRASSIRAKEGPQTSTRTGTLRDGNETSGIKSPLAAAPLGTYTGWIVTTAGPLKGQSWEAERHW